MLASLGISTFFAWLQGRSLQWLKGTPGYVLAIMAGIVLVVGGLVYFKSEIVAGAVSTRDLIWTRKVHAAADEGAKKQKQVDDGIIAAAEQKRDQFANAASSARARTAELERQIAAMKANPICIPKDFWRKKK